MLPDTSHDDALAPPNAETQLRNLGWSAYLWNQVNPAELENTPPVRITQDSLKSIFPTNFNNARSG